MLDGEDMIDVVTLIFWSKYTELSLKVELLLYEMFHQIRVKSRTRSSIEMRAVM